MSGIKPATAASGSIKEAAAAPAPVLHNTATELKPLQTFHAPPNIAKLNPIAAVHPVIENSLVQNIAAAEALITAKAAALAWTGAPKGPMKTDKGGYSREYAQATIYAAADAAGKATAAFEVHGSILVKYVAQGGDGSGIGFPTSDEAWTPDGKGRFNNFHGGAIYWTAAIGAQLIYGAIYTKWISMGGGAGGLGYPITDEASTPDGVCRFNNFDHGAIYFTPALGPFFIWGAIYTKWISIGGEAGGVGYPITDETRTPDGLATYNTFHNGAALYCSKAGTCLVYGDIYKKWISLGGEQSFLGYPVTDEAWIGNDGARFNDFRGGSIYWTSKTGAHAYAGASTKYDITIDQIAIDEIRSRNSDTLYITASISTISLGVRTVTLPLGDHGTGFVYPKVSFPGCAIKDDEVAVFSYLVVNQGHDAQPQVIQLLQTAMQKIGTVGSNAAASAIGTAVGSAVGAAVGAAIGSAVVPLIGTAVGAFAGWAINGGIGLLFANCDGVVAARVSTLRGGDMKAKLAAGQSTKENDDHPGTDSPAGCGSNSHYHVSWEYKFSP